MEEGLKNEIIRLVNLKKTTKYDVKSMETIVRNNIDSNFSVCTYCVAQIKFAQRQLKNWYNSQTQPDEVIEVVVEPKKTAGCSACKNKKQNKK